MKSLLIGLSLIAAPLQMPTLPPGAELSGILPLLCPTPAVARSYTVPAGEIHVYSLLDDTVFGVLTFDNEDKLVAFVYENGKVVVFTSIEELNKKHAVCDDAAAAAIKKKGI